MQNAQIIDWLGIQLRVPREWEIVRHSSNAKAGTLIFIDRRTQRMQVSWTECLRKPDISQIFSDFRSRDVKQEPECTQSEIFKHRKWTCYRRTAGTKQLTRCGIYDKKGRRWIDLILPWSDAVDEELEKSILENFYSRAPDSKKGLRWRAFNMDFTSPAQWELKSAEAKFALVSFVFEKGGARATVSRYGAPETWYDGHLEHFLKKNVGDVKGAYGLRMHGAHEACTFKGRERRFHPRWMVGKRKKRNDIAWHCPSSRAVFQIMTMSSSKADVSPGEFAVHCCRGAEK
jgi:hypothetical protein